MTNLELFFKIFFKEGQTQALDFQKLSKSLNKEEIHENKLFIPDFANAKENKNMLERPIGFICKTKTGNIVKLLQNYDSNIYPEEPEALEAQWGYVWSSNPQEATAFIAKATSPYMIGDCCIFENTIYKSLIDSNVFPPNEYPQGWEKYEEGGN